MAADDLSTANLAPVAWTSSNSRDATLEAEGKNREKKVGKFPQNPNGRNAASDLEFERIEHELDSIA